MQRRPRRPMDYLLMYDYCTDVIERRAPLRTEHLALAWAMHEQGVLILAGALVNPVDGAVFHFRCESPEPIKRFIEADPYVRGALVTQWQIREWATVVGDEAATPTGKPADLATPRA